MDRGTFERLRSIQTDFRVREMAKGFVPEQLIAVNAHRSVGRRVHAVRLYTMVDVVAIAAATVIAVCVSMLAWHIFTVAMEG